MARPQPKIIVRCVPQQRGGEENPLGRLQAQDSPSMDATTAIIQAIRRRFVVMSFIQQQQIQCHILQLPGGVADAHEDVGLQICRAVGAHAGDFGLEGFLQKLRHLLHQIQLGHHDAGAVSQGPALPTDPASPDSSQHPWPFERRNHAWRSGGSRGSVSSTPIGVANASICSWSAVRFAWLVAAFAPPLLDVAQRFQDGKVTSSF